MKRFIIALIIFALVLCIPAGAAYEEDRDYMQTMLDCALRGDSAGGEGAQRSRDEKIDALGLAYPKVDYQELYMLSKLIEAEAGSCWLSMEWKMSVGEVVINRMASPEFPDTMLEVIEQPGQYYGKGSSFFEKLRPSPDSLEAARRLLEGERILCDESVVFQSNYILGSGIHTVLHDQKLGYTYLCYSSYPELYQG